MALLCGIACAEDAPRRVSLAVREGSLTTADGGTLSVSGGCHLDSATCQATARELVDLRVRVVRLEQSQGIEIPTVVLLVVSAAGAGYLVARVTR